MNGYIWLGIVIALFFVGNMTCAIGQGIGYEDALIEWVGPDAHAGLGYYIKDTRIYRSETQHIIYEYYVDHKEAPDAE